MFRYTPSRSLPLGGRQYSESVGNGGGPVGAFSQNWNQPDFGAGQPGWLGARAGGHAGWAKRIDNGNPTATFDDPVGTIMTHGPTSLLWKAPTTDAGGLASLSGGLWNLRHLGRSGTWKVYKNSTVLTEGTLNDNSGSSASPLSLSSGSAGDVLHDIPYRAGDEFRLEVLQGDFVGVKFNVSTYASGIIDPEITSQPRNVAVLAGGSATFSVTATGSAPVTYQWQRGNTNIPGATGATLTLQNVTSAQAGEYKVIVTSPAGTATSSAATLTVLDVPGGVREQEAAGDGLVVLEAEHFNQKVAAGGTDWLLVTTPAGFSGEGAMLASPDAGRNVNIDTSAGPRMDYKVHFNRAGTYRVWVRGLGDSAPGPSASDSVNVGINNSLPDTSDRITGFPQDAGYTWSNTTLDGPPATLVVPSAGAHLINVWMREDGQIVDKIILTLNASSTFTSTGPAESPVQGEIGPELDISRSGANITISWTGGGGTLQSSTALPGNWGDVQGASNPYQTQITGPAMFFRVRR